MTTLNWIDFTAHNTTHNENVRAFSVKHPQAGNLVVMRGVEPEQANQIRALGFTQTRDGAWVIPAGKLNARALRDAVYPLLGVKKVLLSDIDLTAQYTTQQQSAPISHPGLTWLEKNAFSFDDTKAATRFTGPIPSALSNSLFEFLADQCEVEKQPNGQIHYRGKHNGQHYLLQRRQRLLGGNEHVIFTRATLLEHIPEPAQSSFVPTLFAVSKALAPEIISPLYYASEYETQTTIEFTPSKALATVRAKRAIHNDTRLISAIIPITRPLVLADAPFSDVVSLKNVLDIMDESQAQRFVDNLPEEAFIAPPGKPVTVAEPGEALINARQLATNQTIIDIATSRGFDAIVFYRHDLNAQSLSADAYINSTGYSLNILPTNPASVAIQSSTAFPLHYNVNEVFNTQYGRGDREGFVQLIHKESGTILTKQNNPWFSSLVDAIDSLELIENNGVVQSEIANAVIADSNPIDMDQANSSIPVLRQLVTIPPFVGRGFRAIQPNHPDTLDHAQHTDYASALSAAVDNPREWLIQESSLTINRPVMHEENSSLISFARVEECIGFDKTVEIFMSEDTLEAASVFNNDEYRAWFLAAGYDGATYSIDETQSVTHHTFTPTQREVIQQFLPSEIADRQAPFQGALFGKIQDAEGGVEGAYFTFTESLIDAYTPAEQAAPHRPVRLNTSTAKIKHINLYDKESFGLSIELDIALHEGFDAVSLADASLLANLSQSELYKLIQEEGTPESIIVLRPQRFTAEWLDVVETLDNTVAPDRPLIVDPTLSVSPVTDEVVVAANLSTASVDEVATDEDDDSAEIRTPRQDALEPPLFEESEQPSSASHTFTLLPGKTDKQFIVRCPGIVKLYDNDMVRIGGRFVKVDNGYRFKRNDEKELREFLSRLSDREAHVQVIDQIRRPFECKVGAEFTHNQQSYLLTRLYKLSSGNIFVEIERQGAHSSIAQILKNTSLAGLEYDYDLSITNIEQLPELAEFTGPIQLNTLTSEEEVYELLAKGKTIQHNRTGYSIADTQDKGWTVVESEGGYAVTTGGDPRGGGFSKGEAIDKIVSSSTFLYYFSQLNASKAESDSTPVLEGIEPDLVDESDLVERTVANIVGLDTPEKHLTIVSHFLDEWINEYAVPPAINGDVNALSNRLIHALEKGGSAVKDGIADGIASLKEWITAEDIDADIVADLQLMLRALTDPLLDEIPEDEMLQRDYALPAKFQHLPPFVATHRRTDNETLLMKIDNETSPFVDAFGEYSSDVLVVELDPDHAARLQNTVEKTTPAIDTEPVIDQAAPAPRNSNFLIVDHVGDKPISPSVKQDMTSSLIKGMSLDNNTAAPSNDMPARISLSLVDKLTPADTQRSVAQSLNMEFDTFNPEPVRVLHGSAVRYIGRNSDNEVIYSVINHRFNGQRFCITNDNQIIAEPLEENARYEIVAKTEHAGQFLLIQEHTLTQDSAQHDNIVSLNARAADMKKMTLQELETQVNKVDPNQLIPLYLTAFGNLHYALKANPNLDPFTRKSLDNACERAAEAFRVDALERGYGVDLSVITLYAEKHFEQTIREHEEIVQAALEYKVVNQIFNKPSDIEQAMVIPMSVVGSWAPHVLHDTLEKLVPAHNPRKFYVPACLLLAKFYLSAKEVIEIEEALQAPDIAEFSESLWLDLNERLVKMRALTEIPSRIMALEDAIENETSRSPIPNNHRRDQIRELHDSLAAVSVDIASFPITDQDIEEYYESHHSDAKQFLAEKYHLSYTQSSQLIDRIQTIIGERYHQKYLASPERACLEQAHALIQAALPEGLNLSLAQNANDIGMSFRWGKSHINIGQIETREEGKSFSYHLSYGDIHTLVKSDTMPEAKDIALDALSFAERYKTPDVQIWKTPRYGEFFGDDAENKYNTTVIAKSIRETIKAATNSGVLPRNTKVSVKKAGHNSINVELLSVAESVRIHSLEYIAYYNDRAADDSWRINEFRGDRYSNTGKAIIESINNIANAWNFDQSDLQSDYHNTNYYYHFSLGVKIHEEIALFKDEAYANREIEKNIHSRALGDLSSPLFYKTYDLAKYGFSRAGGRRIGLAFSPTVDFWTLEESGSRIPTDTLSTLSGLTIDADAASRDTVMGLIGIKYLHSLGAFDEALSSLNNPIPLPITDSPTSAPSLPTEPQEIDLITIGNDDSTDEGFDSSVVEHLSAASLAERIDVISEKYKRVKYHTISVFPSKGLHRVREWVDGTSFVIEIASTLRYTDTAPVFVLTIPDESHHAAYAEAVNVLSQIVSDAHAYNFAMPYLEACCLLRYCEEKSGNLSFVLSDDMRQAIDADNADTLALYQRLVDEGMTPDIHRELFVNELPLVLSNDYGGLVRIGQKSNGKFCAGGKFIDSRYSESKLIPLTEHSTEYATQDDAIVGFIQRVFEVDSELAHAMFTLYLQNFAEGNSPLHTLQFSSLMPLPGDLFGFGSVTPPPVTPKPSLTLVQNKPLVIDVDVRTIDAHEIHEVSLAKEIPLELSRDLSAELESAGGVRLDERVIFSADDDYASILKAFGLEASYFERQPETGTNIDMSATTVLITPALALRLATMGFVPGATANQWVIKNPDKTAVIVMFYPGVIPGTCDIALQIRAGERHLRELNEGISPTLTDEKLLEMIDLFLERSDLKPIYTQHQDIESSDFALSNEEVCQILLAAEIEPEFFPEDGVWRISGKTFALRNIISAMGGKFTHAHERAGYQFDINPIHRLAVAIKPYVAQKAETHHTHGEFDCFLEASPDGHSFLVKFKKNDDTRDAIVYSRHTTLKGARLALAVVGLEHDPSILWDSHYATTQTPLTQQEPSHAQPTPPALPRAVANENTPGRRILESLMDSSAKRPSAEPLAPASGNMDQRPTGHPSGSNHDASRDERAGSQQPSAGRDESVHKFTPVSSVGESEYSTPARELFNLRLALADRDVTTDGKRRYATQAIKLLFKLRKEQRDATDDEKNILARMIGMGADIFNGSSDPVFGGYSYPGSRNKELRDAIQQLGSDDYKSLSKTILTSFYTPLPISDFMWYGLQKMGLDAVGRPLDILEPAVGVGHFIGSAPDSVRQRDNIMAVECDTISADITKLLYPEIKVIQNEFQRVLFPAGSKDLIIGNPPYSDVSTYNPNTKQREVLHDLFLRESIKALRPGGITAFVTSSGTLDKTSSDLRREIYRTSDLVFAIRLPTSAFSDAGTSVVTDILYFRKRLEHELALSDSWLTSSPVNFTYGDKDVPLPYNNYYKEHPHRILGELKVATSQFGLKLTVNEQGSLDELLTAMREEMPTGLFTPIAPQLAKSAAVVREEMKDETIKRTHKIGSYFLEDGEVRVLQFDMSIQEFYSTSANLKTPQIPIVVDYLNLKAAIIELLEAESRPINDDTDKFITSMRKQADSLYDTFVKNHGAINKKENRHAIRQDPDYYFVSQVEHYDKKNEVATKADILSKRVTQAPIALDNISTAIDAAYASINQFGFIDPEFTSNLLGMSWDDIQQSLGDAVFLDPTTNAYTMASLYLTGDVISKREAAERALTLNPAFQRNIDALIAAMPQRISLDEVRIKLGAPWIPADLVQSYLRDVLGVTSPSNHHKCTVTYNPRIDSWDIKVTKGVLDGSTASRKNKMEYGTASASFVKLLKCCLEQTLIKINYEDADGRTQLDTEATQKAQDKQAYIEETFLEFIKSKPEYIRVMEDSYNYIMNRIVLPKPNGKYLTFPGMASTMRGKPFVLGTHQIGVVERAITSEYGLLIGHEAGGGKTITKVACAIKVKQLGIAKKPMIAVPNHMLVQYTIEALEVFPSARILTVSSDELTPTGRLAFASKVRMNDWDIVICTHEQFKKMSMPPEYVQYSLEKDISELDDAMSEAVASGDRISVKNCERARQKLSERLTAEMDAIESRQDDIDFTALGVDWIAYDESHYLKNRAFATRNSSIPGVQTTTSGRARDAEMKFDWIRESRGDSRGVVLATGTFLCNTIGELMVILRSVAPQLLLDAGITSFDHFIANFGEVRVHIEITPDGSGYQIKSRLSRFHNIPELMRIFALVADVKMGDALNIKRPEKNVINRVTYMTDEQKMGMAWLAVRSQRVKARMVTPREDNYLAIGNDLRKLSIDQRLIHPGLSDDPGSKLNVEIADIIRAYHEGSENKETQLIFIDLYRYTRKVFMGNNPKTGKPIFKSTVELDLVEDAIRKLVDGGIPRHEIGSIHDTKSDEDKENLFAKMRAGDIRVCFGTTAKMGVGTNVQTRGKDLRHLSYPMRSIDIEQRNKRFERQGNMHSSVNLHYPTTKGSGDMGSLQMLDRKSKSFAPIYSIDFDNMERTLDEDFEMTYEELMAITTDNPEIQEKLQCDTEVEELKRKRRNHSNKVFNAKREIDSLENIMLKGAKSHLNQIDQLAAALQPYSDIEGNGFSLPEDPSPTFKAVGAEAHRSANKLNNKQTELPIGHFKGITVFVTKTALGDYYLTLDTKPIRKSVPLTKDLSGFPSRLKQMVESLLDQRDMTVARVAELETEIAALQHIAEQPFPLEEKYLALIEKQSMLTQKVMALKALEPDRESLSGQHPFEALMEQLDQQCFGVTNEKDEQTLIDDTSCTLMSDAEIEELLEKEEDNLTEHLPSM